MCRGMSLNRRESTSRKTQPMMNAGADARDREQSIEDYDNFDLGRRTLIIALPLTLC